MNRITKDKWIDYVMNFLAVCLGIAITFTGEGIVSRINQNREVRSSLLLVKNELQDNLSFIEMSDSLLALSSNAAHFLVRYEGRYGDAPRDSMALYCNVPFTSVEITHSEDALELLKNSSLFTKIKDMDLSLDIIRTYGLIEDEMKMAQFYQDRKIEYLQDAISPDVKELLSGDNATAEQLWTVMTRTKEGRQYLREMYRLQMYHDSTPAREAIASTVNHIDEYIGRLPESK
ncbi:MAG: hypothetical protein MJY50_05945 [Bacteroidales bacterium]|nr:hypothetical protein [Bacteroidales bacterium]